MNSIKLKSRLVINIYLLVYMCLQAGTLLAKAFGWDGSWFQVFSPSIWFGGGLLICSVIVGISEIVADVYGEKQSGTEIEVEPRKIRCSKVPAGKRVFFCGSCPKASIHCSSKSPTLCVIDCYALERVVHKDVPTKVSERTDYIPDDCPYLESENEKEMQ